MGAMWDSKEFLNQDISIRTRALVSAYRRRPKRIADEELADAMADTLVEWERIYARRDAGK
jgi:hypothetical protein